MYALWHQTVNGNNLQAGTKSCERGTEEGPVPGSVRGSDGWFTNESFIPNESFIRLANNESYRSDSFVRDVKTARAVYGR